ncbi:hypothetical protein M9978_16590 [Sphingomonas sp. MG17]|uniref:Uncharacterized protein n=1 Tax=Sphingomonas tagetis TaxID=2949092 RepID=A0A9X2HMK3_9SPHN|nr:hypothetical protein [Sphingomonas tagetis]MCP3732044.1 hypothetical protein [Sphingomonas tagetis]
MTDPFRDEVEAFLRLTSMKPTRFSALATRDRHFVRKLRLGRRVFDDTKDRVRQFMRTFDPVTGTSSSAGK